jgi:hypothetical protein
MLNILKTFKYQHTHVVLGARHDDKPKSDKVEQADEERPKASPRDENNWIRNHEISSGTYDKANSDIS